MSSLEREKIKALEEERLALEALVDRLRAANLPPVLAPVSFQQEVERRFEGDLKALPNLIADWCSSMGVHGYRHSIMDLATMLDHVKAQEDGSRQRATALLKSRDQRIRRLVVVAKAAAAHFNLAGTHSQADVEDRFFGLSRSLKAIQPGDLDV